jgi:hypothetical protein
MSSQSATRGVFILLLVAFCVSLASATLTVHSNNGSNIYTALVFRISGA